MTGPLLRVEELRTTFRGDGRTIRAVDGVDFTVDRGETVCLVGESGSGKTVTCESITGLTPGTIETGSVRFDGDEVTEMSPRQRRDLRGNRVAYVFQNPQNALDPVYTVRRQLVEVVREHTSLDRSDARRRAIDLLERVGIPNPSARAKEYPQQFSGGMRQRVLIAMALAGDPDLLVADEPTTALDVTTEAEILDLLDELQSERGMAVLFVTHDLGIVSEIADRVVVLYGGKVMERGSTDRVFGSPRHPYTRGLLRSLPGREGGMRPLAGEPPDPSDPPSGCRFHPRCPHAVDSCETDPHPPLYGVDGSGEAACVYYAPDSDLEPGMLDEGGDDDE